MQAIAAFERTLVSGGAPFDRYVFDGEHDFIAAPVRLHDNACTRLTVLMGIIQQIVEQLPQQSGMCMHARRIV